MVKRRDILFFILLSLIANTAFAQLRPLFKIDSTTHFNIEAKTSYGFIAPHNVGFNYLIQRHIPAIEIDLTFPTIGNKLWHQLYRYPTWGLGYYHCDLGNPEILGKVDALFTHISVPWLRRSRFTLDYQFQIGLSYLSKCFDTESNYLNIAVSTHLNAYLNLGVIGKIMLTDRLVLTTGCLITHFSNGSTKVPNRGFNIFSAQAGLVYQFGQRPLVFIKSVPPRFVPKTQYSVFASMGVKQIYPIEGENYVTSCVNFCADRQFSYKYKLGAGLDVFYDPSIKKTRENEGKLSSSTKDYICVGVHLSASMVYNRVTFGIEQGVYLYNRPIFFQSTYNRYGFKYRIREHLSLNLSLRAYNANADCIEWGAGYIF